MRKHTIQIPRTAFSFISGKAHPNQAQIRICGAFRGSVGEVRVSHYRNALPRAQENLAKNLRRVRFLVIRINLHSLQVTCLSSQT
jgi:hypothetical protein